jgi:hypothetical protein
MEDAMKLRGIVLSLVLAGGVFAAVTVTAKQAASDTKKASAKKQSKWQGTVLRISKEQSSIDLQGGPAPSKAERKIIYDDSTQWTKGGKPGQQADVKEGSFVIVLGQVDDKGALHATRVDLRLPR